MTRALPEIPVPELSALVRAVRCGASTARSHKDLRAAAAAFLVILATLLHSASAAAWNSREAHSRASHEEFKMNLSARGVMVASALAVSSGALAQNAVQWRVEDGGNGHWYGLTASLERWPASRDAASLAGGVLASVGSNLENNFIASNFAGQRVWIGARRDPSNFSQFIWIDGAPFTFFAWEAGEPNTCNPCGQAEFVTTSNGAWDDTGLVVNGQESNPGYRGLIEWGTDCNNDGTVDYGQIRAGELLDANGNNIPDCCEQGFDCRFNALEWRVEFGGNGHWYRAHKFASLPDSRLLQEAAASQLGASVAAIESQAENTHVFEMLQNLASGEAFGVWIGLYRSASGNAWQWTSGLSLGWNAWGGSACAFGPYPNDLNWPGELGTMIYRQNCGLIWDDTPLAWISNPPGGWVSSNNMRLMLEFSTDCNADGIVDYGQIRAGELADVNANNIPDCCESGQSCNPCAGDVDDSGAVNGVDLAAVLNNWGTNGGKYPGADTNHDGVVDGSDLAQVLGGWGPCH